MGGGGEELFRGKWESGDLELVGFELGLEGCSCQEGNEVRGQLMENREEVILRQDATQKHPSLVGRGKVFLG